MYSHFLHFFTSCTCHIDRPMTCLQHLAICLPHLDTCFGSYAFRIVHVFILQEKYVRFEKLKKKFTYFLNSLILVTLSFFQCSSFSHHNSMSLRFFSSFFTLSIFNLVLFHVVHFPFYSFSIFFISASTPPVVGAFGLSEGRVFGGA